MCILCAFADVFHLIHFYLVDLTLDNCSCEQLTNQTARLPVSPRLPVVLALLSVWSDPRYLTFLFPHPYLSHPGQNLLAVSLRLLVSDHYRGCQSPRQPSSFGLHPPPELSSASPDCSRSPQSHSLVPVFPCSILSCCVCSSTACTRIDRYRNTCLINSVWTFCLCCHCFGDEDRALICLWKGICMSPRYFLML